MNENSDYIAIFIPGGHGAMLGLPENNDLNKLLHWSHKKDLFFAFYLSRTRCIVGCKFE
jgi:molecular chaperone Hsp31 and glyoxalase 3